MLSIDSGESGMSRTRQKHTTLNLSKKYSLARDVRNIKFYQGRADNTARPFCEEENRLE